MKIIILSASTGGGHMSAANCVKDYFNNSGDQAEVIDTLEYINHVLNKTVTEIYEYVAIKHPTLWKMIYKTANNKKLNKIIFGTNAFQIYLILLIFHGTKIYLRTKNI